MMEKYLIIYDDEGYIIQQMSGSVREPIGIPFLWVEVPANKRLVGINVENEIHEPIFEEFDSYSVEDTVNEHIIAQIETELDIDYRISLIELGLN